MNHTINKELFLSHPIDTVWKAITDAQEISDWFLAADFVAEVGYQYTFNSTQEDCQPIIGHVKQATPYTLAYSWEVAGTGIETLVTWKLQAKENGTQLTLTHSGIENYQGETVIEMFDSFSGGWDNCLSGLETYLKQLAYAG